MKRKKNNVTELVFILDTSGSMSGLESDTAGGVNSVLREQQSNANDTVYVTTVLFNTINRVIHDRVNLSDVTFMNKEDVVMKGGTALYDAIGSTIERIETIHKYARKEDVPQKTLFVIMTDGEENSSRTFYLEQIKEMVKEKQDAGWEFVFLSANLEAAQEAEGIGIGCFYYEPTREGLEKSYKGISRMATNMRSEDVFERSVYLGEEEKKTSRKKGTKK